ncbi:MAG TPA: YfhO family protein [Verrucomicrobiae bacterium]
MPAIAGPENGDPAAPWLTPLRFALVLAVFIFAAFPSLLLGTATFAYRDFGMFSYPVAFFHKESFWRGEIPLWNPYNYCGIPFLAQWNTMVLYPPSVIYLLLPLTWSLPFFCLAHLFSGGLGMYYLAREWTRNQLAAGVAGVIFSFSGLMLNFLMWPSHAATFAWVPWVLWLVPRGWRHGGKRLAVAAVAASLQMLAGGPETILFTWVILLFLACGEWFSGSADIPVGFAAGRRDRSESRQGCRRSGWIIPFRFLSIAILVALVCAAQLLPFLQLLSLSQRNTGFGSMSYDWSMPLWGWANFLVPLLRNGATSHGVFYQPEQQWTSSYYVGVATIFLACVALWRARDWRTRMLGALVLLALILALGDRGLLYRGVRWCLPLIGSVRYPVKFTILISVLAPLLAAIGIAHLMKRGKNLGRFEWGSATVLLILTATVVVLDRSSPLSEAVSTKALTNALARAGFFVAVLASIVTLLQSHGRRRILVGALLLALCWLDLFTHVPNQNPTVPPAIYAANWARNQQQFGDDVRLGESRVMLAPVAEETLRLNATPSLKNDLLANRLAFFADSNLLDGVPQVYGFFSLAPYHMSELANLPYVQTNRDFSVLIDFMGATKTTVPGKPLDWEDRPNAMPIVTAGQKPVFADEKASIAALLQTNVNFRRIVLLPAEARASISTTSQNPVRVLNSQFERHKVRLQVETPAPSMVVISQSHYPAWQAFIDGKPAKIWRANYAFQALEVPAGKHEVLMKYQDRSFRAGVFLSSLGLIACVSVWLVAKE